MLQLKKINNEVVEPLKIKRVKVKNTKGYEIIPEIYSNIFLCARKKSGKTSVIAKILKSTIDKNTSVIVFCATCHKDASWKEIKNWLKKKNIPYSFNTSMFEEDGSNILDAVIEELKKLNPEDKSDDEKNPEEDYQIVRFYEDDDHVEIKAKKKKLTPKYVFIFDDMSHELKYPRIQELIKQNRHFMSKVIISSQYPNDLKPESRKNLDYLILFGGHSDDKLEELFHNIEVPVTFETFLQLYKDATKEKYNFLYIDIPDSKFRKNFNQEYLISS